MPDIQGTFEPRYEPLVELFREQSKSQPAGGAALSVFKDGKAVVNVWQGQATPAKAWSPETISVMFSCTKGVISILANRLMQLGQLDPEEKIAHYWPEFAQAGKENIPVKWALQHKAGLSAVRRDLTLEELVDGHTVLDELAAQEPLWTPGTAHGYHAMTFGHLAARIMKGATGKNVNELLHEHITGPLGVKLFVGLPESELVNLAPLLTDGKRASTNPQPNTDAYWVEKAMTFGGAMSAEVAGDNTGFNDPRVLAAELAGANGVTSAHALAKTYSATVTETDGVRLLNDETIERATRVASEGPVIWNEPGPWPKWGMGFMLDVPGSREYTSAKGFGHDGLGGQAGFADPVHKIGFGYITNYLNSGPNEQKNQHDLIGVLKAILNS